ncbi:MAG: NAD-binding protein [Candidatus Micrarchaeota archaeon]|nr:NAD-binding protein [Candidatus Micrarchaeota archaeon]
MAFKWKLEYPITFFVICAFILSVYVQVFVGHIEPSIALFWTAASIFGVSSFYIDVPGFYNLWTVQLFTFINALAYLIMFTFVIAKFVSILSRIDMHTRDMKRKIDSMSEHVIVCGYGKVGKKACEILDDYTMAYVVVERDAKIVTLLREMNIPVVEGDATHSKVLKTAGIERAGGLIAALDNDTKNVYITLTARELNQNLLIASRAVSEEVVSKMHRAGAEIVVLPNIVAGLELGREMVEGF